MHLRPGIPVLVRDDGSLQVGIARPLVMRPSTAAEARFLSGLEGRRTDINRRERTDFAEALARLIHHGAMVEPDPSMQTRRQASVRIHGLDAVGTLLASGLAAAGLGSLSLIDARILPSDSWFGPRAVGLTRATAAAMRVNTAAPHVRLVNLNHAASVEVFRSHGVPPIAETRGLMSTDTPHVAITTDEDGLWVGPLVTPGDSACLMCLGLALAAEDACWPRLALQLGPWRTAGLDISPDAACLAAGIALRMVLAHVDGVPQPAQRWRVPFNGSLVTREAVLAHSECGCGAPTGVTPTAQVPVPAF